MLIKKQAESVCLGETEKELRNFQASGETAMLRAGLPFSVFRVFIFTLGGGGCHSGLSAIHFLNCCLSGPQLPSVRH